ETTYRVTGMTCGHCALSVREEVEELTDVERAIVDHAAGTLVVHGTADAESVRAAVAEAGYHVEG
ncbi:MAG: cation transporter, partial [Patulibacter sp.]